MQHDLDYDRVWEQVSKRFWRRRWRELAIHATLFMVAQLLMLFDVIDRGVMLYTGSEPYRFLYDMGIDQLPYITVNWAIILAIHIFLLIGVALGERSFRYGVERELLRDFAQQNRMDEKRKMRPVYNDLNDQESGFEMMDEADEAAYRQSAR